MKYTNTLNAGANRTLEFLTVVPRIFIDPTIYQNDNEESEQRPPYTAKYDPQGKVAVMYYTLGKKKDQKEKTETNRWSYSTSAGLLVQRCGSLERDVRTGSTRVVPKVQDKGERK